MRARAVDRAVEQRVEQNALLRGLPDDEYARVIPFLETLPLPLKLSAFKAGERIDHVWFPQDGVFSLLAVPSPRTAVEVGTIGNEGMVGMAVFHGAESAPQRCFVQVEGSASRMAVRDFTREIAAMPRLRERLHRYANAFFNEVAQSVGCNLAHTLEQRCARWLLMTHDRVSGDEFTLTQEFLALMLGTRRESVSLAAGALQRRGCIEYSRGRIEIVDRKRLESAACACYRVTRAAYSGLARSR